MDDLADEPELDVDCDADFIAEVTALRMRDSAPGPATGRALFAARLSSVQRARRATATTLVVLAALMLVLATSLSGGAGGGLRGLFAGGSGGDGGASRRSAQAVTVCKDCYYMMLDATWATVTLDGQQVQPPALSRDPPLVVAPGQHTLEWWADPFPAQTCRLSVPDRNGGTCQVYIRAFATATGATEFAIVFLREYLNQVSPDKRDAALAALRHAQQQWTQQYHGGDT